MLVGHCSMEAQFLEDFQGLFYCCTKTMNFLEMWQWCQKWFPQFHQKVLPANRILWSMKKGPKSCQKVGSQINPFFICRNSTNHKMIFSYFRKETKHLPIFPSIKNHSSLPRNKSSLWQRVFLAIFNQPFGPEAMLYSQTRSKKWAREKIQFLPWNPINYRNAQNCSKFCGVDGDAILLNRFWGASI